MNEAKEEPNKPNLDVFCENELVGQIATNDEAKLRFAYAKSWLENKKSFPISVSIPLTERAIEEEVSNNFFVNLLPEERIRKRTCEKLGISEGNNYELLRRIGGDCAGALTIVEEGKQPPKNQNAYDQITKEQLADWSKGDQYAFTEVAGDEDVRLSLAGAQDKLPVKFDGEEFYLPKGNSPSTHIIKFASHFSHLPANETFTTMLGKAAGVEAVNIALFQTSKSQIAVVERYDRIERDGSYTRIHQEDFCQALSMHPNEKYQQEGGPSLKQCIDPVSYTHLTLPTICSV